MDKTLSRRSLMQAVAALVASPAIPGTQLISGVRAPLALGAVELKCIFALLDLIDADNILHRTNTLEDLVGNGGPLYVHFTPSEVFGEASAKGDLLSLQDGFSKKLGIAWQSNLFAATIRLDECDKIERVIAQGMDIKPDRLFSFLKEGSNRGSAANSLLKQYMVQGIEPNMLLGNSGDAEFLRSAYALYQHSLDRFADLPKLYPDLGTAPSLRALITIMRDDIAKSLALPLQDGCFDRVAAREGIDLLQQVLEKVPELFPPQNLSTLRKLVKDIKLHGRQTIKIENPYCDNKQWNISARDLNCSFGLTEQQNFWGLETPKLTNRPDSKEANQKITTSETYYDWRLIKPVRAAADRSYGTSSFRINL